MSEDSVWVIGSPFGVTEGDYFQMDIAWQNVSALTTPVDTWYRNERAATGITADASPSVSANVYSTGQYHGFTKGRYVLHMKASADGLVQIRKLMLIVQKAGQEQ
jgi:hypothetical protein